MDGKFRTHPHYPLRYGLYKATDRNTPAWQAYLYDLALKVTPKRFTTGETVEREAWKKVQEYIDQVYGQGFTIATEMKNIKKESVETILTRYIEEKFIPRIQASNKPEHHQKKMIMNKQRVANRIIEKIGNLSPNSLDSDVVDDYINNRKKDKAAEGTIKLECELLKLALRKILKARGETILAKIKGHQKLTPAPERKEIIDPAEFQQIKDVIPIVNPCRFAFHLQFFCGMRTGEVIELMWENVKFDKQCLHLHGWQLKEKKPRYPYIDSFCLENLRILWEQEPKGEDGKPLAKYVFHKKDAEKIALEFYYKTWIAACRKCGFVDTSKNMKDGGYAPKYRLHDCRRSRVSIMMDQKVPIKMIQEQCGHSAVSMVLRYTQTKEAARLDLADRMEAIDRKYSEEQKAVNGKINKHLTRADEVAHGVDTWNANTPDAEQTPKPKQESEEGTGTMLDLYNWA
jgi:integrase